MSERDLESERDLVVADVGEGPWVGEGPRLGCGLGVRSETFSFDPQ